MESRGVARGERLTRGAIEEGRIYPQADFDGLRRVALQRGPEVLDAVLSDAGLERVDVLIAAHLDPETERRLVAAVGARARRAITPDFCYAYSASLPTAFARAIERGEIARGETVALLTAGGGASWGACVLRA